MRRHAYLVAAATLVALAVASACAGATSATGGITISQVKSVFPATWIKC